MSLKTILYARYSTEHQSAASIEDQFRVCRARASCENWSIAKELGDDATSGSIRLVDRRAGRDLASDILASRFDILLLESLDRLSRDQIEQETWVRRMEHAGIRIVGISDGYDSQQSGRKLMRGVRGLINELYIDDLRFKTHRGQTGKVITGFVAGGKSFGYKLVRHGDPANPSGSTYEVDPSQAAWVRYIFDRYANGDSCQKIAHALNAQHIPSPRGNEWCVSALYGSPQKGTGVLNNVLYVGRYIWNRSKWTQDPDTKKRVRVDRPKSEWHEQSRPELQIVDSGTWAEVRARIDRGRDTAGYKPTSRPPSTLFGGLIRCPYCPGSLTAIDAYNYGCGRAKDRGPTVCKGFRVRRKAVDTRLTEVIKTELLSSEAAADFAIVFDEERRLLAGRKHESAERTGGRIRQLEAEVDRLVTAISAGGHSVAMLSRLNASEAELTTLRVATAVPTNRHAHGSVDAADIFRTMLLHLDLELARDSRAARNIIADLVGQITVELRGPEVWARLATDRLVNLAAGPFADILVAGTGFEPVTFGL